MKPWEQKAHKVIEGLCRASYLQANIMKNGKRRKKHVPYPVPPIAERLIECLKTSDEYEAKAIFISLAYNPEQVNDPA